MPNIITDLIVDRVDLVDEGANSASFIELYKRKETQKMTIEDLLGQLPEEHAAVVKSALSDKDQAIETVTQDLTKAKEDLEKAQQQLEDISKRKTCKTCGKELPEDSEGDECGDCIAKSTNFDETEVLKGLPKSIQDLISTLSTQKTVAEEALKKANDEKKTAEAIAKAAELKNLPVAQEELVEVLKSSDQKIIELLTTVNSAIDVAVLGEVGKRNNVVTPGKDGKESNAAWGKIEAAAETYVSKNAGISKQKAISIVIKEQPELYKEYLNGGAN